MALLVALPYAFACSRGMDGEPSNLEEEVLCVCVRWTTGPLGVPPTRCGRTGRGLPRPQRGALEGGPVLEAGHQPPAVCGAELERVRRPLRPEVGRQQHAPCGTSAGGGGGRADGERISKGEKHPTRRGRRFGKAWWGGWTHPPTTHKAFGFPYNPDLGGGPHALWTPPPQSRIEIIFFWPGQSQAAPRLGNFGAKSQHFFFKKKGSKMAKWCSSKFFLDVNLQILLTIQPRWNWAPPTSFWTPAGTDGKP